MSIETKNPLARAVKRILDFFRVIAFISLILWPISALVMTIGQSSHAAGDNFDLKNSLRIRKFGYVAIGWALTSPLLQYFGGRVILQEYSLNLPGIVLSPAFEINGGTIFIGLAMIVLSGVLNEAASINESHELTI